MRKAGVLAVLLLVAPSFASAKTLDELLVEKGVITKGEAAAAQGSASGAKVYYQEGTKIEFPDTGFTTKINTLIQTRFTHTDPETDEGGGPNTSSFDVTKARLVVSGTALHQEFAYYLQGDFVGGHGEHGDTAALKDAYIQWQPCENGYLRMGQYKTGVSRQFNTKDYALQFADRSVASDHFDFGRNQGATAAWKDESGLWEASASIFNGNSTDEGENSEGVDTNMLGIATVRVNPLGKIDPYIEGDVDHSEELGLSIGASYAGGKNKAWTSTGSSTGVVLAKEDVQSISADVVLKYQGFSAAAEYFWGELDVDGALDKVEPTGGYVQAGYFLTPQFEVAGRYAIIDCDVESGAVGGSCSGAIDDVNEASGSLNYYFWKHQLKAQLGYAALVEDNLITDENVTTNRWIFQLSAYL